MSSTITIGSSSFTLCAMPIYPGFATVELGANDVVATVTSPFTQYQQTQWFPGGDFWDVTCSLPPMTRAVAAPWEGFVAALRGRANVFQLGDARNTAPLGAARGIPLVTTSGLSNSPMSTTLVTRGWVANVARQLLPGDQIQVGYRLHRVCEIVNSDSSGNATIQIWPSLREQPPDATPIILSKPKGLFRLATNRRVINWSPQHLTSLSLQAVEAR